jgi:hypothetical protein
VSSRAHWTCVTSTNAPSGLNFHANEKSDAEELMANLFFRSKSLSVLALFPLLTIPATNAYAWFASWQPPPEIFNHPYPAKHLAIIRSDDTDQTCGDLWDRSGGRVWARACTIAPQDDPGAMRIRFSFIASHTNWAARWNSDPKLCVIVLPRAGPLGVDDETSRALLQFEEAHCWGWREHPPH